MTTTFARLLWQVPLTVLTCVISSLAAVWAVSRAMGLTMDLPLVAVLSAALSAAVIAMAFRGKSLH